MPGVCLVNDNLKINNKSFRILSEKLDGKSVESIWNIT